MRNAPMEIQCGVQRAGSRIVTHVILSRGCTTRPDIQAWMLAGGTALQAVVAQPACWRGLRNRKSVQITAFLRRGETSGSMQWTPEYGCIGSRGQE